MEKNRMEIVGMERNSEWKIERKEENGWNIQEIINEYGTREKLVETD